MMTSQRNGAERQRLDDVGGEQHARNPADGQPERGAQAVALLADEPQAADRHQKRARPHHDRERRRSGSFRAG